MFFGYYDKPPWDESGRYLLAMETPFIDRMPAAKDAVAIGVVDLEDGNTWHPITETRAWCWQQGTMLHWLISRDETGAPIAPDRHRIIYNDRDGDTLVSVVRDLNGETVLTFPRPVYCLRPDHRQALSVNFARIAHTRPGYGYEGVADTGQDMLAPEDDGIWVMDLETGAHEQIVSIRQAAELEPKPGFAEGKHWFNHLQYCTGGSRFVFLHRWGVDGGIRWGTRMLTARPDGSDLRILADDCMTSHFDWRDATHILAWARQEGRGDHYYLFDDTSGSAEIVGGELLTADGHCSYNPRRDWILTDTYPDKTHHRTLILYHPETSRRVDIARFYSPPEVTGPMRCDLHPRWSRDGRQVCVDSVHEDGVRGMYIGDVSDVVG